jgi:hypothetical protein
MKTQALRHRSGKNLNVWLRDELVDAFEDVRKESRRSKTAELELALEAYLKSLGRVVPPRR